MHTTCMCGCAIGIKITKIRSLKTVRNVHVDFCIKIVFIAIFMFFVFFFLNNCFLLENNKIK